VNTRRHIVAASLVLIAIGLSAELSPAQPTATLTPADAIDARSPYRPAVLSVDNDSPAAVSEIRLRWQQGGPTFIHPVTIAPRATATVPVDLPAIAVRQRYEVRLLPSPADQPVVAADIVWPEAWVNAEAFLSPSDFEQFEGLSSAWPARLRRQVFLVTLVAMSLVTGAFLIRHRPARRIALVAILAAATSAAIWLAMAARIVTERLSDDGRHIAIVSHRTVSWSVPRADLAPVYAVKSQIVEDSMLVAPNRISLTVRPGEIRLLRRQTPTP
jgi:hypothetical protein